MAQLTTIQISKETKKRLDGMKERSSETYEEVIEDLLEMAAEEGLELSEEAKKGIAEGREDVKKGRVYTTKELIKELGL